VTEEEAAEWMLATVEAYRFLDQSTVAMYLQQQNENLIYFNDQGSLAVSKRVLAKFRTISPDHIVWSRSGLHWRHREEYDQPGRMQP
jgi:hypothetical protein